MAYICRQNGFLHVLLRKPFFMSSGIAHYHIAANGVLSKIGSIDSVHGSIAAHLCITGNELWCAKYTNGTAIRMPEN